ncbi:hypothetical protein O6H91_05G033300 [Diphasiastrum complanatum]|uniref:Uncharacterized protein n=2 Tax=Diphasiastrum complanatum TaxID=34168 RepID=A0ACC2DMM8_DIPCM|nr:hypothetical protein O6H91_05G033300 [Diphasiastrum complanatum]KAJ7555353.1 hypothetical protein O6H91_05G033300 [Diphasiastrum complanatum]
MDDAFNYSSKLVENHQSTETEQLRYEDFFGRGKKQKRDHAPEYNTADLLPDEGDEETDEDKVEESDGDQADTVLSNAEVPRKSAHEKKLEKIRMQVEQLEKENLEPKSWTLQGEVTAAKRPKNSALEVELDFEHNVRPPPVITEEVTASLEDLIKRRIGEEQFDDVERKPRLPIPSPSLRTEIDENKSQKGLADIYEAEYVEKSGLAAPTLSSSEKLKEEATSLFKALCGRLDSLSHFHFAPKPIVEDMTIRANVPALAMEEVAPLAVSDASMLAPEEVFSGQGLIKDEKELTQSERKRRRARKKRKFKAEWQTKELAKKVRNPKITSKEPSARLELRKNVHSGHSSYTKSSKVFAELDKNKGRGVKIDKAEEKLRPSFLKL